jgi:hypothetical protein
MAHAEWLVAKVSGKTRQRDYAVFKEETALFRTFAELPPRSASIRRFARQYGFLETQPAFHHRDTSTLATDLIIECRERIDYWKMEIAEMGQLVELWQAIINKHISRLKQWIRVAGDGKAIGYQSLAIPLHKPRRQRVTVSLVTTEEYASAFKGLRSKDFVGAAKIVLMHLVNHKVHGHAVGVSFPALPPRGYEILPRMLLGPGRKEFSLDVSPVSLISAMWMQFASAIVRQPPFGRCRRCEGYFEFRSKTNRWGKRAKTIYCSTNCRVRASETKEAEPAPSSE